MSLALIQRLNAMLLAEMPEYRGQAAGVGETEEAQRNLLRALMNVRPPLPLTEEFVRLQDELLTAEREERGVIDVTALSAVPSDERMRVSTRRTRLSSAASSPATAASTTRFTVRRVCSCARNAPRSWSVRDIRRRRARRRSRRGIISLRATSSIRSDRSSAEL